MRAVFSPVVQSVQSIQRAFADGAVQAATLVPLLFVLPASQSHAQLPRAQAVPAVALGAPVLVDAWQASAPLALASREMTIRIDGARATVFTRLVYRNDGAVPVNASYLLGAGAQVIDETEDAGCGGDAAQDADAQGAEFAEVGEPQPPAEVEVTVAPGESIVIGLTRAADVFVRGSRHRLVLPVMNDERALFTPEFSARVEVRAGQPITSLVSATHGGEVTGVGDSQATIEIESGRAYTSRFLAVEFETGEATPIAVARHELPMFQINARARR